MARPETDIREIFVRTRAPYVPMIRIDSEVPGRMEAAGILLNGKRGPHVFRHHVRSACYGHPSRVR
ncbi:hypothetical protein BQ8482_400033 [Mesorhizobium delmotii]|uniref:Uncharacterized protein n=1 Tax=Mesorhizobium delmotii TaxID=1631247 RepID=A0A2P9AT56_9HYPH|nr:hypothetical protein BQ8482_400033 [Mesorhizobium delmotii]